MFKNMMITLSICIVLSLCVVGFIIYKDINSTPTTAKEDQTEETSETERKSNEGATVSGKIENEETANLNPFGGKETLEEMNAIQTEDYIHEMSHQKVIADVKWGFYEITDERIDWLLDVVQQSDFPNKKVYEGILSRWKKDDFSNIIDDHNSIWRLQGGTVGKATGTLSEEEEQAYIMKNKKE